MVLDAKDAPLLKTWLMKRLKALQASSRTDSDVDADILAEYVVALLQHDTSSASAKEMCRSELYDFLKDETGPFVDEVFEALSLKSFLPGARQPSTKPAPRPQPPAPTTQLPRAGAGPGYGAVQPPAGSGSTIPPANGSRKRTYNESSLPAALPGGAGDRAAKQPRRSNGSAGILGGGRGGADVAIQPGFPVPTHSGYIAAPLPQIPPAPGTFNPGAAVFQPDAPMVPAGMSPNGPQPFFYGNGPVPQHLVENLMRMQQQLELALSSYNAFAASGTSGQRAKKQKRARRCHNLEKKGVCNKVNCRFDHTPAGAQMGLAMAQPQPSRSVRDVTVGDRKATIVVERIPDEFFNEKDVRSQFSTFGNIDNVMIDPQYRVATVVFDTPAAAHMAVTSPKTLFDNRFVTVSHFDEEKPQHSSLNQFGYGEEEGEVGEATPELDMDEFRRKQEVAQKEHEEKKRLLEELAEQQQSIDDRLKRNFAQQLELRKKIVANMSAKLKRGGSQQAASEDDDNDGTSGAESPGSSKSKSAAQALQTELIRAQLATLETEAKLLGIDPDTILGEPSPSMSGDDWPSHSYSPWTPPPRGGGYGRGRGSYTPRGRRGGGRGGGRGGYQPGSMSLVYAAYSLDNRPRRVTVSGCDFTDPVKSEALRQHLLGVGDFSAIDTTDDHATITFGDRRTAEAFFHSLSRASGVSASSDSKLIPGIDEPVELSWVAGAVPAHGDHAAGAQTTTDRNGTERNGPFIMEVENELEEGEEREKDEQREEEDRRHRTRLQRQNMDFDVADEGEWDLH
ncbi:uncharacterized protein SPSK_03073 [Sporothrix schenckii 1099-18]|uniref:C3H1-type domain-containing protein n=2 Tax=Sporothrix schenckii TaxID=29908 RepID=U7PTH7_SPOS1|nr:uncharacterized protein SPSK_03073 [Sporothrix schenckii 1099-18]ERS97785.1 hypothetical protein HMPREF1624_05956 [Sporothrix schenckii ATCC 58251]KJR82338.1 hypothetical protein SPSK_03073 [Sporothrix schenckii 1099-18]